ncbi:MAG: hypothetical protein ACFFCZ_03010 [Promethearchaeota archaeon]
MNKFIEIDAEVTNAGITIKYLGKKYRINYPTNIWQKVPSSVKLALRDNLVLASTLHLPMVIPNIKGIQFSSGRPLLEPYFFQNFIMDIPSCTEVDGIDTGSAIQKFLQIELNYLEPEIIHPGNFPVTDSYKALVGMSFGKDSLLTYAVAEELELNPEMIYVVEQSLKYEEKHKTQLGLQFKKEFGKELHKLVHETGKLRDYEFMELPKSEFGWGLQNTEYALELIPFAYTLQGKYIFFGNEQSAAVSYLDKTALWRIYPCYDQTHVWTTHINQITQLFTGRSVQTGSLIEPLMDIMIQRILIRRYPEYAKYQMSCFTETEAGKDYRWCQECSVCSKMYLLASAGGMDPTRLGFTQNMLELKNKHLFTLFGGKSALTYANTGLGRDEQLFNFYLASKKGITDPLIENFKQSQLFEEAKEREEELYKTFCSIYESISVPKELKSAVLSIYKEEIALFEV